MIRTRFAPSPTGSMHIGNLRTALYAYALAKHSDSNFILRIEDTDKKREIKGGIDEIKDILTKFGFAWDEYYVQSERLNLYKNAAEKLISEGHAFYCQCEAKNAKEKGFSKILRDPCRDKNLITGAIKLKVPDEEKISFTDYILGKEVSWNTSTVGDATLLKSDGYPTYHLAVVVDDTDMKISHILRGHDWMPSTPIHLLVYRYLGYKVPEIGHLTDILDPDGGKLSKRKGSVSCEAMLSEGYLPEAILNFVMLLGWAPKDNRELFTLDEFVKAFDPKGFQKTNPVFNREKLDWFNGYYIRQIDSEKLTSHFSLRNSQFAQLPQFAQLQITKLIQERITKLSDLDSLAGFFWEKKEPNKKLFGLDYKKHLETALSILSTMKQPASPKTRLAESKRASSRGGWDNEAMNAELMKAIKENNFKVGDFFMSLRIAITGSKFTPPINESMVILGKDETIARLNLAISNS